MDADLTCNLLQLEFMTCIHKKKLVAEPEHEALTGTDMTSNFSQSAEMSPAITVLKTSNLPQAKVQRATREKST